MNIDNIRSQLFLMLFLFLAGISSTLQADSSLDMNLCLQETFVKEILDIKDDKIFHVRFHDGKFELLVPKKNSIEFQVVKTSDINEAKALVHSIDNPLNLNMVTDVHYEAKGSITDELKEILSGENVTLTSRIKEPNRLKNKIFDRVIKGSIIRPDQVRDIIGTRILTNNLEESKKIANKISGYFYEHQRRVGRVDNKNVKERGYRAYHLDLRDKSGRTFELQIMTKNLKQWDSWNHDFIYKTTFKSDDPYLKKLKEYSQKVASYINNYDEGIRGHEYPQCKSLGIKESDCFTFSPN